MADTFKKAEGQSSPDDGVGVDDWKIIQVEKEHQPDLPSKIKTNLTYRGMEDQLKSLDDNITSLTEQKAILEAEMVEVKTAAEA